MMADAEDKKPGPEPQELEAAKPVASQPSADGPDVSAHKADAGSLPQAERGRDVAFNELRAGSRDSRRGRRR